MNTYQNHPLAGAVDLDSAFNKFWDFYRKYFVGLYIISVAGSLITSLFISGLDLASLQTTTDPAEMLEMMKGFAGPYALAMLATLLLSVLLHVWVLEKPSGEPGFMTVFLKKAAVALIPYLVTMILFGILAVAMVSLGLVLLVLPGLFAIFYTLTVGIFAMPVTLVETSNPFQIISRSFSLAHRNLWPNMGWVTVFILILIVTSLVLSALVMLPFTGTFIRSMADPENAMEMLELTRNPLYLSLGALTSGLITPVMPILAFLLYFRNRGEEVAIEVTTESEATVKVEDLYPPVNGRE
ncbi:MAG: hypothetical protein R2758_06625 [Bacteroidales bacterium]